MRGKNNGVPVLADLPMGWEVLHYEGRKQPWTLYHELARDKHRKESEVVRFCVTLAEAQAVSRIPLNRAQSKKGRT